MPTPEQIYGLRKIWQQALGPIACSTPAIEEAFTDIERRYSAVDRYYHTLDHIWQVTRTTFELSHPTARTVSCDLAAILHDVIYDSRAKDNEERSAEYAHEVLASLSVGIALRDEVARLILLTKRHETTDDDRIGQILLDADLAILGADEPEYDTYAAAIRREYDWVSDADYRAGRCQVLKRFLARSRLYFTPRMIESHEVKARANLAREIASLDLPPPTVRGEASGGRDRET